MGTGQNRRWANVTSSGKLHFNKEQLARAKQASALEYARSQGYDLIGKGNRWRIRGHDSMVFRADGRWYWNSRGYFGRAIEFVMYYENRTFPEAVLILNGVDLTAPDAVVEGQVHFYTPDPGELSAAAAPKVLQLPPRSKDMRKVFGYLTVTRGIDYELLLELAQQGRIFQTEKRCPDGTAFFNAAFAGLDESGKVRSLSLRACVPPNSSFKVEVYGSDKGFPFRVPGGPDADKLCVFESAIDALSHATIQKLAGAEWDDSIRIAMGGNNSTAPILRELERRPQLQQILLCLDADAGGKLQGEAYCRELTAKGVQADRIHFVPVPYGKDWNDYLKKWRKVIRNYARLPDTEYVGSRQGVCCGRIHHLSQKGAVEGTVAYYEPEAFATAVRMLAEIQAPFVAETPEQLQELEKSRTDKKRTERV